MRENLDMAATALCLVNADSSRMVFTLRGFIRERWPVSWLETMERARVAYGARCSTVHVSEREWLSYWLAGIDPAEAVHLELEAIAD